MNFDRAVARLIDHTILKPEATRDDVRQVCAEALKFEFASVCVNPFWTKFAAAELRGFARESLHRRRVPPGRNHHRPPRSPKRWRPSATARKKSTW